MADGFTVDRGALSETSQGINDTIGALKGLGFDEEAEVGRGFSGVALRGLQIGHPGLHGVFGDFCDRWSWGVRSLVQDGNEIAVRLGLSAGLYHDTEQYLTGAAKDVVGDMAGNPYLTDAQVENETWSQTVDSGFAAPDDLSGSAWQQAGGQTEQTWKAEGRDVAEGQWGMNRAIADALGAGNRLTDTENQLFGPPAVGGGQGSGGSGGG
jgi:hypothetical protein